MDALRIAGLTEGEYRVYTALLKTGKTSVGPLVHHAHISRSKIYDVLGRLKQKGLVSEIRGVRANEYEALDPERLLTLITEKQLQLKEHYSEIERVIPTLRALSIHTVQNRTVRVYEGMEGMKALIQYLQHTLTDEYCGIAFPEHARKHLPVVQLIHHFHQERALLGGRAKILCPPNDRINRQWRKNPPHPHYEFRTTHDPLPPSCAIIKDAVITFVWGHTARMICIIDHEHAKTYRHFFDELWTNALPF